MAMLTLYPAKVNSPSTTLSASIDIDDMSISVLDLSVFPSGPNQAVLGSGDSAETILYSELSGASGAGTITVSQRAFQGVAKEWPIDTPIARKFTAYDYDALVNNLDEHTHAYASTTHASTHQSGGSDAIKLDDLTAPDDNTDLNASTSKHGLIIKATAPAAGIRNIVAIDNGETVYKNAALVDDTNPAALGTAAPGTSLVAARRDHVHTLPKGGVLSWSEVTGTTQALAVNTGYILNHATTMIVATLPSTAALGDVIRIVGKGAAMWKVAQNASQYIRFAGLTTTTGIGGYLQAENAYDCIEIMCTTANNGWTVISSIGNIVVV